MAAFEALVENEVGFSINGDDIKFLQGELKLDIVKDDEIIDPFYSMSKKARFVTLKKKCVSLDKVPYEFYVGVLTDVAGRDAFSQAYLVYELENILNGKREFYFINVFGGNSDFIRMLSKK